MSGRPAPDETLDLSGVECPRNSARALLKLETLDPGDLLEIIVDDGEPRENVPPSLEQEGHQIVEMRRTGPGWSLLVRAGEW